MDKVQSLRQQAIAIKTQEPRLRNRNLAAKMGISEAELLTLSLSNRTILLRPAFKELLVDLKELGYVMALTRNEACVHERKGVYDNITFYEGHANMGVAVNPDIDLRFFMSEWVYGLAVTMDRGKMGTLYSFQFFNAQGEAVHKVFSTPKSNIKAYHQLVEKYRAEEQEALLDLPRVTPSPVEELTDDKIDVTGFQQAWLDLQDTHDFFGMLRKYEVSRPQALRLAPAGHAEEVPVDSIKTVLEECAQQKVPIMCFVHSKGCIQIHSGEVRNLKEMDAWYNVLDPRFNLHLNMDQVEKCWIVRKPTADGIVTSLELFDQHGKLIVYFFGARKPGKPELEGWRAAIDHLKSAIVSNS
ncbi:MAG: ChuX/HutX family heme-like substrate-binding protein [Bacteroidota bacterium]